jgi:hypothetical protein
MRAQCVKADHGRVESVTTANASMHSTALAPFHPTLPASLCSISNLFMYGTCLNPRDNGVTACSNGTSITGE